MTPNTGTTVGPFKIVAPLGAGGMGEVYRARDTRLDRDVAIKVLPDALTRDPDRVARFEREAKVLASLNHPNIGAIYGFESADGRTFLVLEFVEGQTLATRLKTGSLPLDEVLETAKQIAAALEAAHEKGIVHRDLKPGNVMLRPDGKVKVLDFGLARAMAEEPTGQGMAPDSPTVTTPVAMASPTIPGVILGTAGYMSPEQARGKPVDKRSDIFSFGCVLFEMLTGVQPFVGETVTDSLGAILHKEADLSRLPPGTPHTVRRVVQRCLAKDKHERLHDIADARIELQSVGLEPEPTRPVAVSRSSRLAILGGFAGGAALVGLLAALWNRPSPNPPAVVSRFSITETRMPNDAFMGVALAPDGRQVVFRAVNEDGFEDLKIRSLDSFETGRLSQNSDGGWLPFFSPDGGRVGFFTRGELKCATLASGITRSIVMIDQGGYSGATWLPDDTIVFAGSSDKFGRVRSAGGKIENLEVEGLGEGEYVISPWALPDGGALLCGVGGGSVAALGTAFSIAVYDLENRTLKKLAENGFNPTYASSGHVLYQLGKDGPLMALPFDATRRVATGEAFPVLSDLGTRAGYQVRLFSIARDGTLAYVPKSASIELGALMWVDRQGKPSLISEIDRVGDIPRLSHDGRHVAFRIPAPNCEIWVHDLQRGVTTRLTHEGDNHGIAWSADDRSILFARLSAPQLWSVMSAPANGVGEVEALSTPGIPRGFVSSISPDGQFVLLNSTSENGEDVYLASIGEKKVEPLLNSRFRERAAAFSPDGSHIAYVSDESGREEVYLSLFPSLKGREQVSTGGGSDPVWARDGRELFFRSGNSMMAVAVTSEPFSIARPELLFKTDFASVGISGLAGYDVNTDGQRFLMVRQRAGEGGARVNIVLNWLEELRALGPKGGN